VILLLAPAGYGKTTLARQWAKTLNSVIWLSLTPAHRDVAILAQELAAGIDELGGESTKFVDEYLRAKSNPQRAAREIGLLLARHINSNKVQWLVIDDYQELADSPESEVVIEALVANAAAKLLVSTRAKPSWATSRRRVYNETLDIGKSQLAMDTVESKQVLGAHPDRERVASYAEGWPAVLGLAASSDGVKAPAEVLPAALYDYFAEELYRSAPSHLQRQLITLALAPDLAAPTLATLFGGRAQEIIDEARELGFLSAGDGASELHPLIREFLLRKLSEEPGAENLVREALDAAVDRAKWTRSFELILKFQLLDRVGPVLEQAYRPLARAGRLGTLSAFAASIRGAPQFPPAVVDLVDADVAARDGAFPLATQLARRVRDQLPQDHPLFSKTCAILGQSAFLLGDLDEAASAYRLACEAAQEDEDEAEALYGFALALIQGEVGDHEWVLERLKSRRHISPRDLVRHGIVEVARRHFAEGFADVSAIDECLHSLDQVEEPRVRSSFASTAAYVAGVRAEYRRAAELMQLADAQIDAFDLDFARPHSDWNNAFINLGLRRFGAAEQALQSVEDMARERPLGYHILNARMLRARLALQTGQIEAAVAFVKPRNDEAATPPIHGEFLATRALVLAVDGDVDGAAEAALAAEATSNAVEVRVLAQAARATIAARHGEIEGALTMWERAEQHGAWDPVVAALRSYAPLSESLSRVDDLRPKLAELYVRSNDIALARRAGLRTRSARNPTELLSPRELEVFGLMARGFRNRDIAKALVISPSTVKVHVRHILEKLGVRTRTEAVMRMHLFEPR
jgi:ATP/maltotriose-dependent transcriptional regulator MalT